MRLNHLREEYYRTYIVHHLPFLSRLDERDVAPAERRVAADVLREVDVTLLGDFGRGDDDDDDNSYGEDDEIRFYNHSRNTNNNSSPSRLDVDNFMMEEVESKFKIILLVIRMDNNNNDIILREKTRMDEDIDAVLGNTIAFQKLHCHIAINEPTNDCSCTIVVARVAQPATIHCTRVILRQSRQSKEYTNRLKRFQEEFDDYEVKFNGVHELINLS